jgi:hypothetical protein
VADLEDISILKVDKETSMDVSESRKFLEVETVDKETLTNPIESRKFLEVDTIDKETSMELIETNNQSVIIDEALSVKEHPENEFKKQFNDKSTSIDSMMIDVPSIIDEVIDTLVNMKISHINMLTQVNHENIKKDQLIRVPYQHPNHKSHSMLESMYPYPKVPNQSQCCTYILKHPKIHTTQNQQQRRSIQNLIIKEFQKEST